MELQELSTLTCEDFSRYIGEKVKIRFAENTVLEAEVIEAKELNGYSPLDRKPFYITFRTDQKTEYFAQNIFDVIHPDKGEISMFLSPKGPDNEGMRYEAVFS